MIPAEILQASLLFPSWLRALHAPFGGRTADGHIGNRGRFGQG
jgi:hypothetical protein